MTMMPGTAIGIADFLYEGTKGYLWVEYKYVDNWLNKRKVPLNKISPHQKNFIQDRQKIDIACVVIYGDEKGNSYIVTDLDDSTYDVSKIKTPKQIAEYIHDKTWGGDN